MAIWAEAQANSRGGSLQCRYRILGTSLVYIIFSRSASTSILLIKPLALAARNIIDSRHRLVILQPNEAEHSSTQGYSVTTGAVSAGFLTATAILGGAEFQADEELVL